VVASRKSRSTARFGESGCSPTAGRSPATSLLVAREDARDTKPADLDAEGHFDLGGLPAVRYSLYVTIGGYRLSPKNRSANA
jgi:hypothetical protein